MIDFERFVLNPVHNILHPKATITLKSGEVVHCTANDMRNGVTVYQGRGKQTVLLPGMDGEEAIVVIRHSECPTSPVGATFKYDRETRQYLIRSAKQSGSMDRGEWVCALEEMRPT